ncbi:hypothetical protein [Chryseobacterium sediminis]|jgi:hypothetical protein|uniref:hypothetical protein n=1 Tax=Chryseobacterium sediminis TaxID=1679494 RepID=UPI00285F497D|nr:hypothetical protein [Chryseobacterium sediminis]MDR6464771.1 hypothetical protein [Chryseobacterium sediminis]
MKNQKLKLALKNVSSQKNEPFKVLGIEEIRTIKGGTKESSLDPGECTSGNCQSTNCGWN